MILYLLFYYFNSRSGLLWQEKSSSMVVVLRVGVSLGRHHFVTVFEGVPMAWRLWESLHDGDWNFNVHLDRLYFGNHLSDGLLYFFGLLGLDCGHDRLRYVDDFLHFLLNLSHSGNFCDHIVDVVFCSGYVGNLRNLTDFVDLPDSWLKDLLIHIVLFGNLDRLCSSYDLGLSRNDGLLEGLLDCLLRENRDTLHLHCCCILRTRANRFRCAIAVRRNH